MLVLLPSLYAHPHREAPPGSGSLAEASVPMRLRPQSLPSKLPDPDIAARLHFECHGQPVLGSGFIVAASHHLLLKGILYVLLLLVAVLFPLVLYSFDFS